jgi:hypothetical protein
VSGKTGLPMAGLAVGKMAICLPMAGHRQTIYADGQGHRQKNSEINKNRLCRRPTIGKHAAFADGRQR